MSDAIAKQCNIKTDVLNPLEGLTQEQIDNGENYVTVMRDNFESISKKLLVLVNNFHNGSQYGNQKSQNIYPEKLIDRIRTIKKLKNI